jgi:hypothetical protein
MSFYRTGMLGLALLIVADVAETNAQTVPVMGYVAAKVISSRCRSLQRPSW